MTSPETPSALATQPGSLSKPVACAANHRVAAGRRRALRFVRAWHAIRAAWLARRLKRIETELLASTARVASHGADGRSEILRQDIADYESRCMERAVLRAQIDRCRALS